MSTLAWWRARPTWQRWALGLLVFPIIVLAWLRLRVQSQIGGAVATERSRAAARVAFDAEVAFTARRDAQPPLDLAIDAKTKETARSAAVVPGDGTKPLPSDARGGKLPGGAFDDELL